MDDKTPPEPKPPLPEDKGRSGAGAAAADSKPIEDHPAPGATAPLGPKQTGAGERS